MLTTVEKVKIHISMPVNEQQEQLIEALIKQVGKNVETFCNRYFEYREGIIERFDGGRKRIFLKGFPVRKINYVKVDDVEITDYKADLEIGEIFYEVGFKEGYRNIEVSYDCGYDASSQDSSLHPPEDLEGAVIEEVVSRFENLTTETRTGENLVDLRTNFLTSRARDYFSRQRIPNV